MGEFISSTMGTVFYTIVVFTAGALIGKPLLAWGLKMMPWSK